MPENGLSPGTLPQGLARIAHQELVEPDVVDVSPEESLHLLDYWNIVLKRRWTVLTTLIIVFATVAIGTLKQKPVYQGNVLIVIYPEQRNVLSFQDFIQVQSAGIDSYLETQYRVITSRTLAEKVVKDLELWRLPEFYRARMLLGLISRDPSKLPSPDDPAPDPDADYFRNSVAYFLDSVDVSPVRRSNLVSVSFYSHDPDLAYKGANKLADDYIWQNLSTKADQTTKASEWLDTQLQSLKIKLEKSEDNLQKYAQQNSILYLTETKDEKKSLATERLGEIQEAYTKAQEKRFEKESLYNQVQAGRVENVPGFLENRMIQDLIVHLADAQRDYSKVLAKYKPDYPEAVALKKQVDTYQTEIDRQKKALEQSIVDDYRAALGNEKLQAQALADQMKYVNDLAQRSITYNILKRQVDTDKSLYEGLLQRMKEAQVSAASTASTIHVVDAAQLPRGPIKPRLLFNLALGLILGLGAGIGLAFFQEYLDKTLKTPDEVETLLRLPSLGVLPKFSLNGAGKTAEEEDTLAVIPDGAAEPIAPAIQTDPIAVEAFRSLRTSILLSANPVPKMLLTTSALPSEGKTTVTVNLGATLASLGSKVLIVDCDMRRPACHRATGVDNKPGFVQCLTGRVDLADAILPVPGVANLSVIPCGPIPPNPAEVLSSAFTADLLRRLRDQFEYVLVDSPPLLSVADSRILSTLTDAVVLVARAFSTPYDVVRRARALLYGAGVRILGVALNDVDIRREGYGYDSYRFGYGVGYGYGSASKEDSEHA